MKRPPRHTCKSTWSTASNTRTLNAAGTARVSGEAEHFGASRPRKEHQSSHGSVPIQAQITEQILNLLTLQTSGESSRLTDPQLGTRTRSGGLTQHARALAVGRASGHGAAWHWIVCCRIAHCAKGEHPRDCRHPVVHRRWYVAGRAAAAQLDHVAAMLTGQDGVSALAEETQQRLGADRGESHVTLHQPTTKVQQVKGVGPNDARRVPPVAQIREVLIRQRELGRGRFAQGPTFTTSDNTQVVVDRTLVHASYVPQPITPSEIVRTKSKQQQTATGRRIDWIGRLIGASAGHRSR